MQTFEKYFEAIKLLESS